MAGSRVKGKVAVARIPRGARGPHVSLNAYWILGIGAATPHAEIAWPFLRHCATAAMDKLVTLGGAIRVPEVHMAGRGGERAERAGVAAFQALATSGGGAR